CANILPGTTTLGVW
nr:immunoglobulin heavy chain junction region [Macaca mulatta]MOX95237.1 immunoglobulin heavy chain junction region [Macaca mulatta]MOX96819.1 immunoglobulin heavy chain junction region [Macaca mulatta]